MAIPLSPFYRRYPYRGDLAISSADSRGCIDLQLGFFSNHIPKAANSTIVTMLTRLRYQQDFPPGQAKELFLSPAMLRQAEVDAFE